MGILNLFSQSSLTEENKNLQNENQELKNKIKILEDERLELLNRIEDITRNFMSNPTTLVEETGKALVDLLKESNRANREVTIDMTSINKDLQIQLEVAREKIDSLQHFLQIAARKIGNFEGMLKTSSQLELKSEDVMPLVDAWTYYETTLNKRIKN